MTRTRTSSLAIAGLLAALASGPVAAQTAPDAHAGHAGHAAMTQTAPAAPAADAHAGHAGHAAMGQAAPAADAPACHGMAGMDHSAMTPEQHAAMMEHHQTMMAGMDHSTMTAEQHAEMKAKHEAMMASCAGMAGMDHGAHHPAPEAAAEPAHQH